MKHAVVFHYGSDNIGDDIQTYAAMQLMPKVDYFLDREALDAPQTQDKIKLLCNGWFMENPQHWPPAENIHPLFMSMYIDHKHGCLEKMLHPDLKPYYQQYTPIGCRDLNTLRLFQNFGVDAYYSACLTLTLENKYQNLPKEKIYMVDPFHKILDRDYQTYQTEQLKKQFPFDEVEVISHLDFNLKHQSLEERLQRAEELLKKYATAKAIITSRIHCGLPATGLGTPVYFTDAGYDRKNAKKRLEGLIDFFHVIGAKNFPLQSNQPHAKVLRKLGIYRWMHGSDWQMSHHPKPKENPDLEKVTSQLKNKVKAFLESDT